MITKHVLILGGGFAGLECTKRLSSETIRVTLVDRWNHHLFQPLLYQVASGALAMAEIAQPLRIMNMRNHISVFLHWVWSYFTWQRSARVIQSSRAP
jgi:NADH dehydrogenase